MKKLLVVIALVLFTGIAFGQALKKDAVMLFDIDSEVELKPGVSIGEYIDFLLTTVKPEMDKAWPGTKYIVMQGEREGEKANSIIRIWYFESTEVRDKYLTPEFVYVDNTNKNKMLKLYKFESEYIIRKEGDENPPWPMYTSWLIL